MMEKSVLVLGAVLLCSLAISANHGTFEPDKCCFHFYKYRVPKNNVESYSVVSPHCPKRGIIVTMQNGNEFCLNPDQKWVQDITNLVDQKNAG